MREKVLVRRWLRREASCVLFGAALLVVAPLEAQLTVDTLSDVTGSLCVGPAGSCSLREAITVASAGGVIDFDPVLLPGTLTLDPGLGALFVDKALTIQGAASAADLVIDANGSHRVLEVGSNGDLLLSGVTLRAGRSPGSGSLGGGVQNLGELELVNCRVTDNVGFSPSGALGHGSSGGGIHNAPGATLLLADCTVSNNVGGDGSLTFNPAVNYDGGDGGGVYNEGTATIEQSTLAGNEGGGTDSGSGDGGRGGALFNTATGVVLIRDSLLVGNLGGPDEPILGNGDDGRGGAIYNQGALQVVNSTLTGNSSRGAAGGALFVEDVVSASVRLENVTVASNSAGGTAADGLHATGAVLSVVARNTILADNGIDCVGASPAWNSEGYNLVGNASSCPGIFTNNDQVGTAGSPLDPLLDVLAANGGPTETRALLTTSPAVDGGDPLDCEFVDPVHGTDTPLITDQRGELRPVDGDLDGTIDCDVGAYELHPILRTLSVDVQGSGTGTVTSTVPGIHCTTHCTADYVDGTSLDLLASPDPGSTLVEFDGDCSGQSCSLLMDTDRMVDVEFGALHLVTVTLNLVGSATGSVQSTPGGIDCGVDCDEEFLEGIMVTLSPTPTAGSLFVGWGGDCSGTTDCSLSITAPLSVEAVFEIPLFADGFESGDTTAW